MSSIRVSGNTSGHYDLTVPDVAGSNTIALDKIVVTDSSSNVGIGTTQPDLKLHVDGTNGYPASSGTTPVGHIAIRAKNESSSHGANIGVANASPWGTWIQAQDANNLATNYPLLLNPNGGNVGIGTYNPGESLDTTGKVIIRDGGNTTVPSLKMGPEGTTGFSYPATNELAFLTNSATRMYIDDAGNVGIGTNSPNATLTVSQSANNIFAVERTGVVSGSGQFGINVENNSQATVSYDDGSQLVFGTASSPSTHVGFTERMKISAEGYVTKPNHPAFQALSQSTSNNSSGYLDFDYTILNQGNHFSTANNRFTAPVTGVYHFHFHTFIYASNTGTGQISFYRNGSYSFSGYEIRNYHEHRSTGSGPTLVLTATVRLNKFDYIQIYKTGIDLSANASNYFGGHLIG